MSNFPCHRGQLKSKGHGTLLIYFAIVQEIIETIFRITVSANQLNLYGEVVKMCEQYVTLHDRSGRSDVVMGQSMVLNDDQDRRSFDFSITECSITTI